MHRLHCFDNTLSETTMGSESGVASMRAMTASEPILQPRIRSKAEGAPPR